VKHGRAVQWRAVLLCDMGRCGRERAVLLSRLRIRSPLCLARRCHGGDGRARRLVLSERIREQLCGNAAQIGVPPRKAVCEQRPAPEALPPFLRPFAVDAEQRHFDIELMKHRVPTVGYNAQACHRLRQLFGPPPPEWGPTLALICCSSELFLSIVAECTVGRAGQRSRAFPRRVPPAARTVH